MVKKEESLKHRGRFQAQGGGVEESEAWTQDSPLSVNKAVGLLNKLKLKLSPKELERRNKSFNKAENFVINAGKNGGIFAKTSKSFMVKGSKTERVDIEVLNGKAFIKNNIN